jgi:hypothetical protein
MDSKDVEDILSRLANVVALNGSAVCRIGANLIVQCKFIEATLPYLNEIQRREIKNKFKLGMDYVMSYTDDISMPEEYHSSLTEQSNFLLGCLES